MTTQLDCSIGFKKETTYGTAVTVDQFVEFTSETLDATNEFMQSEGLRVGTRGPRASRNRQVKYQVDGNMVFDAPIKSLGAILQAAFGAVTNNAVPGQAGVFQQVHTPATTDYLGSYTIQKGIPPLGGGATIPLTFTGMMCNSVEFAADQGGLVSVTTEWTGREAQTGPSYAAPSYAANLDLFTYLDGALVLGGSPTAPTTTAIATGGTQLANIRSFSLKYENNLDDNQPLLSSGGKRTRPNALGVVALTGSMTAEFTDSTFITAQQARTSLALVLTFTHPSTIGTSAHPVLQLYIPIVKLDNGLPQSNGGDVVAPSVPFTGLTPDTGSLISVVYVTTDTAP